MSAAAIGRQGAWAVGSRRRDDRRAGTSPVGRLSGWRSRRPEEAVLDASGRLTPGVAAIGLTWRIDLTPRSGPATVRDTDMEQIYFFYRNPA
jgi:hypothetical protein